MNLVDLFTQHDIPVAPAGHHHVRTGWIGIDCPNCSPGWGKFRLGFEIATGRCSCWVCGKTDAAETIATICNISLGEAIGIIRGQPRGFVYTEPKAGRLKLPEAGELGPAHRNYLLDRGFDPDELVKLWGIQGIGPIGVLKWRILIPIHDLYGKVVSWTTRSISPDDPTRYISAAPDQESVPHKEVLYGAHLARHAVTIHEGPFDAYAVGPGATCTFGLSLTDIQMALMMRFAVRAVCFDATPDAQKRARKLCRDLSVMPGLTELVEIESGKDTAEADESEILEIRERYLI